MEHPIICGKGRGLLAALTGYASVKNTPPRDFSEPVIQCEREICALIGVGTAD